MNPLKLSLLSLLLSTVFLTSCQGQTKKDPAKENQAVSSMQSKLIHQSTNIGDNVHGILQDRRGNLWFATTGDGLFRYDGKTFTRFTVDNGLTSNCIFSIIEDSKGKIWLGTYAGIYTYDGTTFSNVPISNASINSSHPFGSMNSDPGLLVFCMMEDRSGQLWFGTSKGVYRYDGKTFTAFLGDPRIDNSHQLTFTAVNRILEDKHGNIWFTSKLEGVCRFDGKSIVKYTPNGEEYFWGLIEDRDGNILVSGREKGLWLYDGNTFTNLSQGGRLDSSFTPAIIQDKSGHIWFGSEPGDLSKGESEGGVWRYNGKTFTNFSAKDGLGHYGVWSLLEDSAGNIWVGTRNTGLYKFDGKTFTKFSE